MHLCLCALRMYTHARWHVCFSVHSSARLSPELFCDNAGWEAAKGSRLAGETFHRWVVLVCPLSCCISRARVHTYLHVCVCKYACGCSYFPRTIYGTCLRTCAHGSASTYAHRCVMLRDAHWSEVLTDPVTALPSFVNVPFEKHLVEWVKCR